MEANWRRYFSIKMDVICDTSFLMVFVSTPIGQIDKIEAYFGKLNFLIPDVVISELKDLEHKTGPKRSRMVKTAIEMSFSKFKVVNVLKSRHVDEAIIDYAITHKCAVATIDRDLRRRLMLNNLVILTLSKNKLIIASQSKT
ncbi:MAG: PIN domain-containing protein [Nitrososphaeraceae archaeon]